MGQQVVPAPEPRARGSSRQRIAQLAVEVSQAIVRAEDYGHHLVDQAHALLGADAGVGLTRWGPDRPARSDRVTVVVGGAPAMTEQQALLARPFASTHPGILAMGKMGTTDVVRLSDHTDLHRFWTTESYWRMHGFVDGRYPASALLLDSRGAQIFLGVHRRDRDFSDADLAGLAALQRPVAAALAFRAALDDSIRLLQHQQDLDPGVAAGRASPRRRTWDAAVRLCRDYAPTRREAEVLTLAAEGWTNEQIGRRLGISERTVRKHLTAVYDKAGVRGRAAAAAWWQRVHE